MIRHSKRKKLSQESLKDIRCYLKWQRKLDKEIEKLKRSRAVAVMTDRAMAVKSIDVCVVFRERYIEVLKKEVERLEAGGKPSDHLPNQAQFTASANRLI